MTLGSQESSTESFYSNIVIGDLPSSSTSQGNTRVSPITTLNVCPLDMNLGGAVTVWEAPAQHEKKKH